MADFYSLSESELVSQLKTHDAAYADGEPTITDALYDAMYLHAQRLYPANVYFTGVGSAVRGGKIKLPYTMGSLNQVQIGEIEDWVNKNGLEDETFIISDKLDGVSGMLVYGDDGDLQIAYSRGDGIQGADITRHALQMLSIPMGDVDRMVVRGEFIIEKYLFEDFKKVASARSGREYKNPRNALAGKLNASENPPEIYNYIDFIAYEIVGSKLNKETQLQRLIDNGFLVPYYIGADGVDLSDEALAKMIENRREFGGYEIDGIVIEVNAAFKRGVLESEVTRDTLNPAYAIKYKVEDASNIADSKVVEVEWNPSKHGYLKPRVRIEPVEIQGTTVQYATGFNAKFVFDNKIGPGAVVTISRQGDVIPNITKVLSPGSVQGPECDWLWSENEVDAIQGEKSVVQHIKSNADFFEKIGAPLLRYKSIDKLNSWGFDTIEKIIEMTRNEMRQNLGKNGEKAYDALHAILQDIPGHVLAGAYSIERGIGIRKMKKIFDHFNNELDSIAEASVEDIMDVEGFDEKTAKLAVTALYDFFVLLDDCENLIKIKDESSFDNQLDGTKFCFTGYRNKHLQQLIEDAGGSVSSSVSKNTDYVVAKDVNSNSGKAKKGRDLGLPIIDEEKLISLLRNKGVGV